MLSQLNCLAVSMPAMLKWRLHAHFEVDRGVPLRIDVTEGSGKGETDERHVLYASA